VTLRLANASSTLARPDIAEIVAAALAYADGSSYHLRAWCIMPDHVHAVLLVGMGETLVHVTENWKKFSAKRARRILRSDGAFWEQQHYQRPLRTEAQIAAAVDYVLASPHRGSLMNWPWVWSDRLLDTAIDPEPMPPMPVHLAFSAVRGAASL
jgi:REP element-mobilizing transposase RayT